MHTEQRYRRAKDTRLLARSLLQLQFVFPYDPEGIGGRGEEVQLKTIRVLCSVPFATHKGNKALGSFFRSGGSNTFDARMYVHVQHHHSVCICFLLRNENKTFCPSASVVVLVCSVEWECVCVSFFFC